MYLRSRITAYQARDRIIYSGVVSLYIHMNYSVDRDKMMMLINLRKDV